MQIEYQIVKQADEKQIMALYRQAGWWDENPANLAVITKIIAQTYCFVIAVLDNKIVGMGRAISDGCSDAYIQDVTVMHEFRGKGIGKRIIQTILAHLQSKGIGWIGLISEPGADKFYDALNFSPMVDYKPYIFHTEGTKQDN